MIEFLGFTGLAIVTAALMQSKMIRFRILSLLGGLFFISQAIMLESFSLILTQLVFASINIFKLYEIKA